MIEWLFELLMAPISWAVTQAMVFAVTAPLEHVYIAMGVAFVLLLVLIWSMIPREAKTHSEERSVFTAQEPTEEDEREAIEILRRAAA